MSHWVAWVLVLIEHVRILELLLKLESDTHMGVLVIKCIGCGSANHSGSQSRQRVLLLLRHLLRHGDYHAVASGCGSHG